MCRWMVYVGKPIIMADIVTRPQNSIVHQSRHSPFLPFVHGHHGEAKVMNTAINGDGFGVGWYDNFGPEPCVFRSTMPSWNCPNLPMIASHVQAHCVFAHVRAASNGSISEANCHPFKFGKMLFMQNGTIAHFTKIRVAILEEIKYTTAWMIEGMTDSEHAGALYVHFLPDHDPTKDHSGHVMKDAMLKMIKFILDTVKKEELKADIINGVRMHTPSNMNFAVTDGTVMIATRYRDSKISHPPSLYFSEVKQLHLHDSDPENSTKGVEIDWHYPSDEAETESVVIASEPLTRQPRKWMLVPRNHLLVVTAHQRTIIEAIEFDEDTSEEVEEAPSDEAEVKNEIEETLASEWDIAGEREERITGEEEMREEVLNDPRNEMKVGKNRGSVEEQKKVRKELMEKAPDFSTPPPSQSRRRHSLATWYPHMASDSASGSLKSLSPLPPTTGHSTPPLVHRANSSVTDRPPHKRSHERAKRLEVTSEGCCDHEHTAPRSRRLSSLPYGTLQPPDLYSSPADPPTSMPASPASASRADTLSPLPVRATKSDGDMSEDADNLRSLLDQQRATNTEDTSKDFAKMGSGQEYENRKAMMDHVGAPYTVRSATSPEDLVPSKLSDEEAYDILQRRKQLDSSSSSLLQKGKASAGGVHIHLDMSKGFLLLAVVNVICAMAWALKC